MLADVPYGYCHCGCGQKTKAAVRTDLRRGTVKGQPQQFLKGHHNRLRPKPVMHVEDDSGCWIWQGYVSPQGYGLKRLGNGGPLKLAHRLYYEQYIGPIPDGLVIDHLCRVRACVNPAHLEPVTLKENILRGEGTGARYARRTHCGKGHPLSGDNLYIKPGTRTRVCRTCKREARR